MAATLRQPNADYHNTLADADSQNPYADRPAAMDRDDDAVDVPIATHTRSNTQIRRESELELQAFEKGRLQGEMEAVRRMESEAGAGAGGVKSFTNIHNQTTIIDNALASSNIVEIEHLTTAQKIAWAVGELCSAGYLVVMALWIDQYRGGAGWSNGLSSANRGQFNVHVICSFIGLWFAAQAYTTYRILPLRTSPTINRLWYVTCHVCALACFGLTIAASILAQPDSGNRSMSMHAWTAYLGVFVYACHAIYSCIKVLAQHRTGTTISENNETRSVAEHNSANAHLTAEQRRDYEATIPTLYRAQPTTTHGGLRPLSTAAPATQYNEDGSVNHNAASLAPRWSEAPAYTANNFFLIPRAKWAVAGLVGLLVAVLVGLGEWQMLLASGKDQWSGQQNQSNGLNLAGTESIIIGAIGLATLLGTLCMIYAAQPPRTILTTGSAGSTVVNTNNRDSVSMANSTAPASTVEVV